ncbi:MAG: clostripain-related cysteine peptidase [bacterium]
MELDKIKGNLVRDYMSSRPSPIDPTKAEDGYAKELEHPTQLAPDTVNLSFKKMKGMKGLPPQEEGPPKKKWTVLFYLDGNNNLQGLATANVRQLETVGTNKDVNLVAQLSRGPKFYDKYTHDWSGAKRYEIQKNPTPLDPNQEMLHWLVPPFTSNIISPVKEDLGTVDMGDPKNLQDFLRWGIKNYPAENYMVVLMDHGAGYLGSMQDEKTGHIISNEKLAEVLKDAGKTAGKEIDIVAFDACLMGQAEVAHQLKDSAKILIGSEENEAGAATPFAPIMKDIQDGAATLTPQEVAKLYVYECAKQPMAENFTPTQSAIDLKKMDGVKASIDNLAKSLKESNVDKEVTREIISKTQRYCNAVYYKPYVDYRDLQDFAEKITADTRVGDQAVKKAAQDVIASVQGAVIAEEHTGKLVKDSHGMSIYLPDNYGFDQAPKAFPPATYQKTHHYQDTPMAKDTQWDEFLTSVAKDTKFHEFLRNLGVSDKVIDGLHSTRLVVEKPLKLALGATANIGGWEAWGAARGQGPRPYLWGLVGAQLAAKLGAIGGGYKAFNGAEQIFKGLQAKPEEGRTQKVVDGVLDTATGAATTAACVGMAVAAAAGITTTAGIVAVALPIAKSVYDTYMKIKAANKEEDPKPKEAKSVEDKLKDMAEWATPGGIAGSVAGAVVNGIGNVIAGKHKAKEDPKAS